MNLLIKTFAALAACTVFATGAFARARLFPVTTSPRPSLIVEPPLPGPLAQGVVFIPYRVENLRILPVGGPAASNVSPRVGHLHITVDDLPWQWADYGQSNTIISGGHAARPAQGPDRGGGPRRQGLHRTNGDVRRSGQGGSAVKIHRLAAASAFGALHQFRPGQRQCGRRLLDPAFQSSGAASGATAR